MGTAFVVFVVIPLIAFWIFCIVKGPRSNNWRSFPREDHFTKMSNFVNIQAIRRDMDQITTSKSLEDLKKLY